MKWITKTTTYIFFITIIHQINYFILVKTFNLLRAKVNSTHPLFHSCQSFPNFWAKLYTFTIFLCSLNRNICQVFTNFFIYCRGAIMLIHTKNSHNHYLIFWILDCKIVIIIINRIFFVKCYCEYIMYMS